MHHWNFDSRSWIPDDTRRPWDDPKYDLVVESPSGQLAAVLYQVREIHLGLDYARIAILTGNPADPTVLFRPAPSTGFGCCGFRQNVHWVDGDRYFVMTHYLYSQAHGPTSRIALSALSFERQAFTLIPVRTPWIQIEPHSTGLSWTLRQTPGEQERLVPESRVLDLQRCLWLPWSRIADFGRAFFAGDFGSIS